MKMTVTEALAELKTIQKRLQKKRESVAAFLFRQAAMKDPLEKEGGSRAYIERERQAMGDLEERVIRIRQAIAVANAGTLLTIGGRERSIAEWLIWRREVVEGHQGFLTRMAQSVREIRAQAVRKGLQVTATDGGNLDDVVVNVDEKKLAMEIEEVEEVLGTLDGLLSLKNATVMVEI